jgi:hypothetical protein
MNRITLLAIFLFLVLNSFAQKLPGKQETPRWATTKIKVDGKINDWNNQFSAYNSNAGIYYAFANDDQNLYLTIQAKQPEVINTIIGYGFTLTLQKTANKNDKDKVVIGYPFFDYVNKQKPMGFVISRSVNAETDTGYNAPIALRDYRNSLMEKRFKSILTKGIKNLDTISVYNDVGIKAASRFDETQAYTLELSIPLQLIPQLISFTTPLTYNLSINGFFVTVQPPVGSSPDYIAGWQAAEANQAKKFSHSDFWGKYPLAKK